MNESEEKTVLTSLKLKLDKLIDRFDEQRGIIDSYVKRERDWKSSKLEYTKKIDSLNDLFIFCYIYHQYDNKIINQTELIHRISTQLHPIDTLNFKTLRCMKECYDFFFLEYSNYGDKIDEIQKNLENKLI